MTHDNHQRDRARQLRRDLSPVEPILWKRLRNRALAGFKFRRQHSIGPFFADLACLECKLVIELDGESHLGQEAEDSRRTRYLQEHGWLVLRFWNTEVYNDLEVVLEAVYRACQARRLSPLTPDPSPPSTGARGEGK